MISKIRRIQKRLSQIDELARRLEDLQKAVGRLELRQLNLDVQSMSQLQRYEFKVFSQWGEDGIIQYLVNNIEIVHKTFVEFGVQDYKESNTRFLLQNNNWSGLIMDASAEDIQAVKNDPIYYRNNLNAVCAFIDKDNINKLLQNNGMRGDIGLLSIDIDGNDYWIWQAIDCVKPRIVICEYDSLLGYEKAVTTPYEKNFDRTKAHYSFLYGGASIAALHKLGTQKGYALVGSNSAGNNAFFVRNDVLGSLESLTPQRAYVKAQFRNSKDPNGHLTFLSFEDSLSLIHDMPLFDLEKNSLMKVRDIVSLT
jgi:hypothetical protein